MPLLTLEEIALLCQADLIGDPHHRISGINALDEAQAEDLSFLANPRYLQAMKGSLAGAICVDRRTTPLPPHKNFLLCDDPSRAFQIVAEKLLAIRSYNSGFTGIHPTAIIHPTARIGKGVSIGPYAVIDRDTEIGDDTQIGCHVSISFEVTIGNQCIIHPSAIVRERCRLGDRVILQAGAVIGSCGFGYLPDAQGRLQKLEQLGIVILEDDVEIGANTTIDRSRFKATLIRRGSKIDNLCQIAHNVEIGEDNGIAAQTGIAGSSKTGSFVMLGGQVGVVGHVVLESKVMVATRGGVSKSLTKEGKYRGSPAIPIDKYHRQEVHVRRLEEYVERLKTLEEEVKRLRKCEAEG